MFCQLPFSFVLFVKIKLLFRPIFDLVFSLLICQRNCLLHKTKILNKIKIIPPNVPSKFLMTVSVKWRHLIGTLVLWKYSLSLLQSKPRLNPSSFKTSRQDVCVQSMQSSQLGSQVRWHLTGERCDWQQNQPLNSAKRQVEENMQLAVALGTWSCNEAHTEDELYLRMLYKKFCRKSCAKGSFPGALRGLRLEGLEVVGD